MASLESSTHAQGINDSSLIADKSEGFGRMLAKFLRHTNNKAITPDGYVCLKNLVKHLSKNFTAEILLFIVENDKKKRFHLKFENGDFHVKAHQGHSNHAASLQDDWVPITLNEFDMIVVHGTSFEALKIILQDGEGLRKMDREWIHFANNVDSKSGIRKGSQVGIFLNVQKCLQDGILLFRTPNNVIMSQGQGITGMITSEYFLRIEDFHSGLDILF